ncbi:ABC transporter permease [Stieleria sp. ICT_E10.1]|uniref:ABC transporter permease n=1 Tax=Stieleria sedimenti TaxID=2976331 RepID=UPI0021801481|nr:ABC transporter permease [Stieleria sedimenti]MCS7468503.1 ABC transporter permease [Stieleria sedimenti]
MNLFRLLRTIRLGSQTIRLHRLRSLLTILGVVFGVASVIVMLAVGEGARAKAVSMINELGTKNVIITSIKSTAVSRDGNSGGAIRYGLSDRDLRRIAAMLPHGARISQTREHRRSIRHLSYQIEGRVIGVTPAFAELNHLRLARGRFINRLDETDRHAVAVLSAGVADQLFPLSPAVGETIRIGSDQYFYVVGVLDSKVDVSQDSGERYDENVFIPFQSDRMRFGENTVMDPGGLQLPEKVEISQLTVSLPSTDQVQPVAQLIRSILMQEGRDKEVSFLIPLDLQARAEQTQRVFHLVLAAIASISLLVGGIGIMNIMLATVTERTREIGIRRALGARRSDIVFQFLIETLVLTGMGGALGVLLGFAGARLVESVGGVATIIHPWSPLLAVGISFAVGLLFGLYPARRAARMDPIEALRHE